MLNYSDFRPFKGTKSPFVFGKMMQVDKEHGIYRCTSTHRRYHVHIFDNQQQALQLYILYVKQVFANVMGFLVKKNTVYCFTEVEGYETLGGFIEGNRGSKGIIDELYSFRIIKKIVSLGIVCQKNNTPIQIISPYHLAIEEKEPDIKLLYPFTHSLLDPLDEPTIKEQAQFCAPEILKTKDIKTRSENYSKSMLYSLGLVLLYCFGYRVKLEQRVQALRKSNEYMIFLKAIRKEIKELHGGKFISKIIKILLQGNETVRDTLQTFEMKLNSPQLRSLRKLVYDAPGPQPEHKVNTLFSEDMEIRRSMIRKTVEIRGSSLSGNTSQKKSERSIGTETEKKGITNLFGSFKKSDRSVTHNELSRSAKSIKVKRPHTPKRLGNDENVSPVDIQCEWQEDDESNRVTPHSDSDRISIQAQINKNSCNSATTDPVITISPIKQAVVKSGGELHQTLQLSPIKNLSKSALPVKKLSVIESEPETDMAVYHDDLDVESEHSKQFTLAGTQQMEVGSRMEEEPEVLQYGSDELPREPFTMRPKSSLTLKRRQSGGVLQEMTLVEDGTSSLSDEGQGETDENGQKLRINYPEIKAELKKRSEAILVTYIICFLVYKISEYFL